MYKRILMPSLFIWLLGIYSLSFAQDMHEHHHTMEEEQHSMEGESQDFGICPVMKGKAGKDYSYTYEGKTYYFCCPACREQFKEEPQKYISKIKEINLEVYQFGFSPDTITVKKDDIVKIYATSKDVNHGVYIKEYNISVPVKKGEIKKIEFVAGKSGEFEILCSVYCGRGHHDMKAKLIVEE